jgi:hypothetical protein
MDRAEESPSTLFRAAREAREDAAALRAESRQARRRSGEIRHQSCAILDAVAQMMANLLRGRGYELREPVAARFRIAESGTSEVEVFIRLEDPRHVNAAKAVIAERFPDALSDVIVS